MAQSKINKASSNVASLHQPDNAHSKGYWQDAFSRLFRNKMAVLGAVIIILNILVAIFAPIVSVDGINDQHRDEADAASAWVIALFPTLKVRDESWRITGDGEILVTMGQKVKEGDLLAQNVGRNAESIYANMDGTIFLVDDKIELAYLEVPSFTLQAGTTALVQDKAVINEGDAIFGTTRSPIRATVYLDGNTMYLRPFNSGYVPLRNRYPLGADHLGRDLWSRIAHGTQVSLLVALIGPSVSIMVGLPYGMISGYFGGWIDNTMMRFVDLMYAFPTLLLIILLMAFFRSSAGATEEGTLIYTMGQLDRQSGGMFFIFFGVGITSWMGLARLTRGQVLSIREQEYVVAARSLGSNTPNIMMKHILPNILGPIIISETLSIPTYIRFEAFLSFIGLGVNPPTPSWGNMISDGSRVLRSYPHEAIFPAVALFLIMFAFNFLGDGLRDALDPRLRGTD